MEHLSSAPIPKLNVIFRINNLGKHFFDNKLKSINLVFSWGEEGREGGTYLGPEIPPASGVFDYGAYALKYPL